MKMTSLLLTVFVAAPALAIDIVPTEGAPICLQRVYTQDQLATQPKQKLTELTIKLEVKTRPATQYDPEFTYQQAVLVTRNIADKKLYGNTAGCNFNADGSANCQIECDGGSFDLIQRQNATKTASWINFTVPTDSYFPFYKGVLEPDIENTEKDVQLWGNDDQNNKYRVEQVPVQRCDAKIAKLDGKSGGCY